MASLRAKLAEAKARLFGSEKPSEGPIPYEVPCACGHRITGIRRSSWVIGCCSECGRERFILPRNVYPTVILPERAEPKRSATVPPASRPSSVTTRSMAGAAESERSAEPETSTVGREDAPRRDAGAERPEPVADVILAPRISLAVRIRRFVTPLKLLGLASVVLIGLTVWWVVRQQRMDSARRNWRREFDIVQKSLLENDLKSLEPALRAAAIAASYLGKDDQDSREVFGLLKETEQVRRLSVTDPVAVLAGILAVGNTARNVTPTERKSQADQFQNLCCAFETRLKSNPSSDVLEFDPPVSVNATSMRIQVRSDYLKRLVESAPDKAVVFIATVRTATPPRDEQTEWVLSLDATSVTLLMTELMAQQVGFDLKEVPETRDSLKRQREFVLATERDDSLDSEPVGGGE